MLGLLEGSWYESQCGQDMESFLVIGEDARTPSEHCTSTLEQGSEPPNAYLGPAINWPLIQGGPTFTHCGPPLSRLRG